MRLRRRRRPSPLYDALLAVRTRLSLVSQAQKQIKQFYAEREEKKKQAFQNSR